MCLYVNNNILISEQVKGRGGVLYTPDNLGLIQVENRHFTLTSPQFHHPSFSGDGEDPVRVHIYV